MAKTSKSKLCFIDVDNQSMGSICGKHNVSAMPTLVYIKGGNEADKMQGVDMSKLMGWVDAK